MKVAFILGMLAMLVMVCRTTLASPGIITAMNAGAVERFANQIIPTVLQKARQATFEEMSGKESHIHYKVSNIHITDIGLEAVKMSAANDLSLQIVNFDVEVGLDWEYKASIGLPRGSGTAVASLTDGNVAGQFFLSVIDTPDGKKPKLSVSNVSCQIGKIAVKTHGSLFSWLYNLILRGMSGYVKSNIEKLVPQVIQDGVQMASDVILATLPMKAPISETGWGVIDYSLTEAARHSNNAVVVSFNAEILDSKTNKTDNAVPRHDITLNPNGSLFQIVVDTFVFNSAFHVSYKKDVFYRVITDETKPESFPLPLNTASFKIISKLYEAFPDKPMKLIVHFGEEPVVSSTAGHVSVAMPLAINVACLVDSAWKDAFTIRIDGTGSMSVSIGPLNNGQAIFAQIDSINPIISVINSSIGDFDITPFNGIIDFVINRVIIPHVNVDLLAGIPLPAVSFMTLKEPKLAILENAIAFDTDIEYNPTF